MSARGMSSRLFATFSGTAILLAGCAQTPLGPSVQVLPGRGKTFEAFQSDNSSCQGFAADSVKGQADAANNRAVGAAVLTTVLGVGLGAAIGSVGGNAGAGAAIGAASGGAVGTGIGANQSAVDQMGIQQRYDIAFSQCMYAHGDQVPGFEPQYPSAPVASSRGGGGGPDPALVRGTQAELVRLHYLNDTPDGTIGPHTSSAIRAYQQAHGLSANGAVSQTLLAKLQSTPAGDGGAAGSTATASSAPSAAPNWVPPTTQGQTPAVTPVSAPAAPNGWVAPKTASP